MKTITVIEHRAWGRQYTEADEVEPVSVAYVRERLDGVYVDVDLAMTFDGPIRTPFAWYVCLDL